jgi:hypothetical protein
MHTLRITVAVGRVLWGYHEAAALRACAMAYTPDGWTLSGELTRANVFRLSQRPLTFEIATASGVQRWPIVTLQEAGGALSARLGPRENSRHGDPLCPT